MTDTTHISTTTAQTKAEIVAVVTASTAWEELNDRLSDRTWISVMDKEIGATPGGTVDCSAAFQYAEQAKVPIYVPPFKFKLATPVLFSGGFTIFGVGGQNLVNGISTTGVPILMPTTAAFAPRDPLSQETAFFARGLGFYGGTTQIDLGLCHQVYLEDIEFLNPTVASLCLVRGESHDFRRIRTDFQVDSDYGFVFGYKASINYDSVNDLYGGVDTGTFFDTPDAWVDRMVWDTIKFQSGATTTWKNAAVFARSFGGTSANNVTWHGSGSGSGKLFEAEVNLITSTWNRLIVDKVNTTGAIMEGFKSPLTNATAFIGVPTNFGGNCHFSKTFDLGTCNDVTFIAINAPGNGTTEHGFYLKDGWGQKVNLIGCQGDIFSLGSNAQIKKQIVAVGCDFSHTNLTGSNQLNDWRDGDINISLYGDTGGSATTNGRLRVKYSGGGGNERESFSAGKDGVFATQFNVANSLGAGLEAKVLSGSGSPEGVVTAGPGSIYLSYTDSTSGGAMYIKTTDGNTGWKLVTHA